MRQTDSIMQVDSWQHVGSFALSNKEMLERGVLTDVTIVAGSSGERLNYLYCGQCSINNETVMALMYAANKKNVYDDLTLFPPTAV
ncbi:hypothetical protein MAR_012172 [Mya arenaria]|uniref:Uncharacterized protein n=1 Tax=Mya arenaria TaxID=6604 RepID=A0ABY7FZZ9_MYAAR|nr:hypothetical protein MAR_012172 [Mya arenaria]